VKHTKLLSIVEDILNEERHIWDTPKVFRNAADATKELKKFPSKLRKYFKVAPDNTRPAGIIATDKFHDKSETIDSNIDYFVYELEGFEIGLEDGHYPDYIMKFREEKWS
jgi:hypothetical protein|tara:strand:- start:295 stop:624 length:330 start_codon:yes stop_codon:yes gene_type:complete